MQAAIARKGPLGILEMLLAPPDEHGGMDLVLTHSLGKGFPSFEFTDHLKFELTCKATSFESQGCTA